MSIIRGLGLLFYILLGFREVQKVALADEVGRELAALKRDRAEAIEKRYKRWGYVVWRRRLS